MYDVLSAVLKLFLSLSVCFFFTHSLFTSISKVKRQAVLAIQTAVTAAETRAIEMITQERIKMEKIYGDISRNCDADNNEVQTAGTNVREHFFLNNRNLFQVKYVSIINLDMLELWKEG